MTRDVTAAALARLLELGPPSEIVDGAPGIAAELLDLEQVVLTRLEDGRLVPLAATGPEGGGPLLAALEPAVADLTIAYPALEGEILRRRRPELLDGHEDAARHVVGRALGWGEHVAAPVVLDHRVVGFLHATAPRPLGAADAVALGDVALCFAVAFERAMLRRRLRRQSEEMRQMTAWVQARSGELAERTIALGRDEPGERGAAAAAGAPADGSLERLRDLLTRRELDVLQLMVAGRTNAGIARELVLSEGTVKFHVKNILRKLHANNRAEATSRYLRLTLGRPERGTP